MIIQTLIQILTKSYNFVLGSLRLLEMLKSKEDVRTRNKKNGCRKGSAKSGRGSCRRNKNHNLDDDDSDGDDDSSSAALAVASSHSDDEEEDLVDCQTANRDALKSQAHNNYVPRCTHDGRYEQIQCYKVINTLLNLTG